MNGLYSELHSMSNDHLPPAQKTPTPDLWLYRLADWVLCARRLDEMRQSSLLCLMNLEGTGSCPEDMYVVDQYRVHPTSPSFDNNEWIMGHVLE